jgi:hypothetical protein
LRLDSSVEALCPKAKAPDKTAKAPAVRTNFLQRLDLIDTSPLRNGKPP